MTLKFSYSPWAKVRRKRYFYGCTLLEGSSFEYTGSPVAIASIVVNPLLYRAIPAIEVAS